MLFSFFCVLFEKISFCCLGFISIFFTRCDWLALELVDALLLVAIRSNFRFGNEIEGWRCGSESDWSEPFWNREQPWGVEDGILAGQTILNEFGSNHEFFLEDKHDRICLLFSLILWFYWIDLNFAQWTLANGQSFSTHRRTSAANESGIALSQWKRE